MNFNVHFSAKILTSVAAVLVAIFTLASCNKEDDIIQGPVGIEGYYSGKYGFDNEVPDTDQRYRIKANGVFQEIGTHSGTVVGQGTWVLDGNQFNAAYTMNFSPFNQYSVRGIFNAATGKLTGTWGDELDPTDGGKIDMTKE